jgi:hypothetical protein
MGYGKDSEPFAHLKRNESLVRVLRSVNAKH